jgi:GNAT superfamily N-acetyltransferase
MEYLIRHMTPEEFPMLEDFLYEAIYAPYRGRGIGSAMMRQMLDELRGGGYPRASQPESSSLASTAQAYSSISPIWASM